jgi:hypothetical protein
VLFTNLEAPKQVVAETPSRRLRTSANSCGASTAPDWMTMVTWAVSLAALSMIAVIWDWSMPKPNASRGKLRASADSNAVCFATLNGTTTGPVSCSHEREGVVRLPFHAAN